MHLYPSVYFHFHATDLLKQYLNETKLTCSKIYIYFNFQLCTYYLSLSVNDATLNPKIININVYTHCNYNCPCLD